MSQSHLTDHQSAGLPHHAAAHPKYETVTEIKYIIMNFSIQKTEYYEERESDKERLLVSPVPRP